MALINESQQLYYDGSNHGSYQFISLTDIIDQFMFIYTGEDKIIPKASRTDVAFHAQRALAELSFDTFRSCKSQEILLPPTLQMILPQDYINYTKVSWIDSSGIKHPLYPTTSTSNPQNPFQNSSGDFEIKAVGTLTNNSHLITLDKEYKNIIVGMSVTSPNIPDKSVVIATQNDGGVTTILIGTPVQIGTNVSSPLVLATYTGNETLTFTNNDGSLILSKKSIAILENIIYDAGEDKLTQSPNTNVSDLKVGMLVSNTSVPVGTRITDVNGAIITISNVTSTLTLPANNTEFTFVDTDYESYTWNNYKTSNNSENEYDDYQDDTYWPLDGERYGLDPQRAQANGMFYIDCNAGKIHFSSTVAGKTIVLDYISDSLGTDDEMKVHKYAEEAMYKCIMYAVAAGRSNIPEYQVNRFKKERFAAVRTAKLRLSNIKLEELTQILRGKSKWIKH